MHMMATMHQTYTLAQEAELKGHEDRVWSLAWNPVRPLLASCSSDKTVRLYHYHRPSLAPTSDFSSSSSHDVKFELSTSVLTEHAKTVRCVAWAPSGKAFATASFDANIAVWEQEGASNIEDDLDMRGGGEWECASLLEGYGTECKCVAYSSSGTLLASCNRDKTVWVWEVQPDSDYECMGVLMAHTQDVKCVAWHPTEEILASGSYDDTIKLYIDDPSDDWYDFQTLSAHSSTVWSLAFSPCGALLASASDDKTIRIWRRTEEKWKWEEAGVLRGHERSVYSVSWTGFGGDAQEGGKGWLASAGGDGRINVWNIRMQDDTRAVHAELITTLADAHGVSEVNCVAWCPRDGFRNLLASAGDDCSVRVWRIEKTQNVKVEMDVDINA